MDGWMDGWMDEGMNELTPNKTRAGCKSNGNRRLVSEKFSVE